jgi:hypothetical protein
MSLFFVETSLNETKEVVRRKLLLPSYATIKLKQLRDGKSIDLDDGKTRRLQYSASFLTVNYQTMTLTHSTREQDQ